MLKFDWRNADAQVIGSENGLDLSQEFSQYQEQITSIIADLNKRKDKPGQKLQWLNLGYNEETLWYVKEYASMVRGRFDNVLVLGIGGSALGGLAVTEALLKPYWNFLTKEQRDNFPRIFFLDNIDPDSINGLLDILDLKKTLVNVITKSGDTAETMAQFMILRDRLAQELGEDEYRKNVVATTDKQTGVLRQISEQEGYKTFVIPDDVGGRFSVFSAVGLLPFALVGIDIDEITNGIKDMDLALKNTDIHQNIAAQNALIQYLMDIKKGKNISVVMPYSSKLKFVADWYTQLWAESLGKNEDLNGNSVNVGPTPVRALGATDQHSQIQLFNEGPNNKVITFIRVGDFNTSLEIPKIFEYTGIGYLGGKTLNDLMNAEADSTMVSLSDYSRPTVTITLPKVNGYYIGQLLYMLEVQTAIAGALYNVNAFNQPGVEQAKYYTYALMGRAGYEDSAQMLQNKMNPISVS
ncbi:glucose-6-phosphate isomerase [bacterium]|nr:glucose-6-phosphate isomerase [bacterium]